MLVNLFGVAGAGRPNVPTERGGYSAERESNKERRLQTAAPWIERKHEDDYGLERRGRVK